MSVMIEKAKNQIGEIIAAAYDRAAQSGALAPGCEITGAVEIPRETKNGDFAATHALAMARGLKQAPKKIADTLLEYADLSNSFFTKVEAAGPGYLNFTLGDSWYGGVLTAVENGGDDYGAVNIGNGERVMVEFVSANPTGPMTIGNARGGVLGDTLASLLEKAGYDVWREFYVNDAGHQVEVFAKSIEVRYIQRIKGEDAIEFPENGYHGDYIREFAEELYEKYADALLERSESERLEIIQEFGLTKNIARLHEDMERYGIIFDKWYHESELHASGYVDETIELVKSLGHTYEKDGALWLRSSELGNEKDEVLRKSNGFYTYYAVDIAYHRDKLEKRGFDKVIDVLGADHHGHTIRFKAGVASVGLDPERLEFLLMQFVNLVRDGETVKMSKRTGRAITLGDLLDEVSRDAARFLFNLRSPNVMLDFDMGLAVREDSENPVYYVQYAHARICSLIAALASEGHGVPVSAAVDAAMLGSEAEREVLKQIALLPEEIKMAARERDPSRINRYVIELAARFHRFYNAYRIKGEDDAVLLARLKLAWCVRVVIRNCLALLGVTAPEKM